MVERASEPDQRVAAAPLLGHVQLGEGRRIHQQVATVYVDAANPSQAIHEDRLSLTGQVRRHPECLLGIEAAQIAHQPRLLEVLERCEDSLEGVPLDTPLLG